jgi:hypothetical protein
MDYDPAIPLREIQKKYVMAAMQFHKGNKSETANALGITIKTLYNWMGEWGLPLTYGRGYIGDRKRISENNACSVSRLPQGSE